MMNHRSRGFTLIELPIIVSIVGIIIIIAGIGIYVVICCTETNLDDLACSNGQVAVFSTADDEWVCQDQAGGGPAFVLLDANGNEVGPVVDIDFLGVLVSITHNDALGTPRSFLLGYHGPGPWSGNGIGGGDQVFFTTNDCTTTTAQPAYMDAQTMFPRRKSPVYVMAATAGKQWDHHAVYFTEMSGAESATIESVLGGLGFGGCDDIAPETRQGLLRAELLIDDLETLHPTPYSLEAR